MMYEDEEWKDIKGFEGLYKISNYGKVVNIKKNKELKPVDKSGRVVLYNNKKICKITIMKLVLQHFNPIQNEKEYFPKRKNKNRNSIYYNHISNLCWKKYIVTDKMPIEYNGVQYKNIYELCEKNNVKLSKKNIKDRLRLGWKIEEILKIPRLDRAEIIKKAKVYWYKYYGKLYTAKQLAEISGLRIDTFHNRLKYGWSVEQAVDTPLLHKGGGKKCKEN